MAAQFTAKTANSEKAIYLSLMSCSSLTLHAPLSLQPSIYIYREREREREREYIYIFYIYGHFHRKVDIESKNENFVTFNHFLW